jgi:hypothetical protein
MVRDLPETTELNGLLSWKEEKAGCLSMLFRDAPVIELEHKPFGRA